MVFFFKENTMPTNWTETNKDGVRLRGQSGDDGVQNFDAILAGLPAELRAAFYAEREARTNEINEVVEDYGYHT